MATYKTPDVYIEEISVFPPSVAEVETCIPAFIGYTQKATKIVNGDLTNVPTRITSMLDYANYFGGAPETKVKQVLIDNNNNFISTTIDSSNAYYLYDSLRLFYANGGGDCYIVSVGDYVGGIDLTEMRNGLAKVEMVDEPTILLFPDAAAFSDTTSSLYTLQQDALSQANKLQDRFCVFDLYKSDPTGTNFRNNVGINYLKYGSAYTPWLKVSLSKNISYKNIKGEFSAGVNILRKGTSSLNTNVTLDSLTGDPGIKALIASYNALFVDQNTVAGDSLGVSGAYRSSFQTAVGNYNNGDAATLEDVFDAIYAGLLKADDWADNLTCSTLVHKGATLVDSKGVLVQMLSTRFNTIWESLVKLEKELDVDYTIGYSPAFSSVTFQVTTPAVWTAAGSITGTTTQITATNDPARLDQGLALAKELFEAANTAFNEVLDAINGLNTTLESALAESFPLYKTIIQGLNDSATEMPPSGAVVGVYAATDRDRGVWKAPANVSLASVVGPNTVFTASQLDALNIDVNAGKSINAIRSFVGKGTLIWGARTLAGNDNEWRYVPVRRFFNTAEESIKKSTYWAVFEPNNGNTWVKVKGMIENYLTNKWKEGALVGAKPDEAFFVRIGLGTTMSAQDILEGYMKVEIGMAVVRPAEFIVLKFSHKLQQS
jgi:uncharacterized protein